MNNRKPHELTWKLLIAALLFAIGGSAWAFYGGGDCPSCEGVGLMFQGKSLALTGLLYYSTLFVAAVVVGPTLFVYAGILIAAGVHGGLLAVLLHSKLFCLPCIGTAGAALTALVLAIRCESANALRASFILPGAALLVQTWVLLTGAVPAAAQSQADRDRVVHDELVSPAVARGKVRLVIYTRPDCGFCMELERDVLPEILRDFGSRLEVERRSAENLPGIPTPTLILTGSEKRHLFPGLPSAESLRSMIETLMGESHGHETVLEKSR